MGLGLALLTVGVSAGWASSSYFTPRAGVSPERRTDSNGVISAIDSPALAQANLPAATSASPNFIADAGE